MTDVLKYWRLSALPFSESPGQWFFAGAAQKSALAEIAHSLSVHARCVIVQSQPQCGVSSLLHQLVCSRGMGDRATQCVMTDASRTWDVSSTIRQLSRGLGIDTISAVRRHRTTEMRELRRAIEFLAQQRVYTVWLVDGVTPAVLSVLKSVSDIEHVSLVMAATETQVKRLPVARISDYRTVQLDSFTAEDTDHFLSQSVTRVGGRQTLFHPRAVEQLHAHSGGRVGILKQLAASSLAQTARLRQKQVMPDTITRVAAESTARRAA
ncbi:hypothetical protein RMSM_04790 [Rhodopirellula maiorica SM1]|uniref:Uncharacterized protein n=1 Tax=Rhodopirellula maiorica SM1 TaxID=1265738 RepID=M5RSD1_9BACT|nr:hypothetical protein [Rhodopirellula maiorica]EMI18277.1 hypothetical protein RMSM_04790 [Rhodopirellula maiorica SM1]